MTWTLDWLILNISKDLFWQEFRKVNQGVTNALNSVVVFGVNTLLFPVENTFDMFTLSVENVSGNIHKSGSDFVSNRGGDEICGQMHQRAIWVSSSSFTERNHAHKIRLTDKKQKMKCEIFYRTRQHET